MNKLTKKDFDFRNTRIIMQARKVTVDELSDLMKNHTIWLLKTKN